MPLLSRLYEKQTRLLVQILSDVLIDDRIALYGGTAINMFYRDLPRYSIDIDLKYLPIENREESLGNIKKILFDIKERLEGKFDYLKIRHQTEIDAGKLFVFPKDDQGAQVKIEINTVSRGNLFPIKKMTLSHEVQKRFKINTSVNCLDREEIFGSKVCAALNRQHPRDLFDIKILFKEGGLTEKIKQSFILNLISDTRPFHEILDPKLQDISKNHENHFKGMALSDTSLDDLLEARRRLIDELIGTLSSKRDVFFERLYPW